MMSWQFFKRYLFSKRSGSTISVISKISLFGIFIGTLSFVLVLSIMGGFSESMTSKLLGAEPHLVIKGKGFDQSNAGELIDQRGHLFHSFSQQDIIVKTLDGKFTGAVAKGLEQVAFDKMLSRLQLAAGEDGSEVFQLNTDEVVLGADLARQLRVYEGDQLLLLPPENLLLPSGEVPKFEKVVVKGVIATEVPAVDSKFLYFEKNKTLLSFQKVHSLEVGLEIFMAEPHEAEKERRFLLSKLNGKSLRVDTWKDRNASLFFALNMERLVMGLFLGLSALIASFSVVTLMSLLVTQKSKEVGVLLAVGMSQARARSIFIKMGVMLSVMGVMCGFVVSLVAVYLLDRFPLAILPDIYYDPYLPVKFSPKMFAWTLLGALTVALLVSWLPVRRAFKKQPIELIKGHH